MFGTGAIAGASFNFRKLTVDTNEPLELPECGKRGEGGSPGSCGRARIDRIVAEHRARDFGVPEGWDVQLNPGSPSRWRRTREVSVDVACTRDLPDSRASSDS